MEFPTVLLILDLPICDQSTLCKKNKDIFTVQTQLIAEVNNRHMRKILRSATYFVLYLDYKYSVINKDSIELLYAIFVHLKQFFFAAVHSKSFVDVVIVITLIQAWTFCGKKRRVKNNAFNGFFTERKMSAIALLYKWELRFNIKTELGCWDFLVEVSFAITWVNLKCISLFSSYV